MQLREKIHHAINRMPTGHLSLLYEQIKALEDMQHDLQKSKCNYTIEDVLEITATSKICWSDSVIDDREERV